MDVIYLGTSIEIKSLKQQYYTFGNMDDPVCSENPVTLRSS